MLYQYFVVIFVNISPIITCKHLNLFQQDLRKHAIYSVLKVGDRIPMIIAITLKSPDYLFKNKPKRIKQ
uniref:hypothetical protein n=1 Tax=Planktothrix agardhii TaxID=1160 RepID=UPI0037841866